MKNKKLNIGYFLDNFYPQVNGVVTSSINTAFEMSKRGHSVYGVAPATDINMKLPKEYFPFPLEIAKGVPAFIYPDFIFTSPFSIKVIRAMKKFKPDIIHFHAPLTIGYLAILIARMLSIPVVGTFHTFFAEPEYLSIVGKEDSKFLNSIGWWYSNQFFNRCDAVVSPGIATSSILKDKELKNKIHVISNGVEVSKFNKFKFNEKLMNINFKKNDEWILFIGRISKEKSIDVLINAFSIVAAKRKNAKLLIVGDGPHLKELKALAKTKKISEKVVFTGMVPNKILLESGVLKKMKLFATASTSENQPMTILESIMFGLPIVGADAKGNPELIEGNGFKVTPGKTEEFADKMLKILEDKNLHKKFSDRSINLSKKYDIKNTSDKMENLYFDMIKKYN